MSKPDDANGHPVAIDPTTDLPPAPPHAGPSTARRGDTSLRSGHLATAHRVGDLESDPSAQTGAYTPPTAQADVSSAAGGDTAADQPRLAVAGRPTVRGYEILGELGRGGMGVVYKARQVGLDRLVALKMILAGAHARAKDLDRFRAEAQAVARFQHPNIVQIYEVGDADGLPYFSLEFVDGGTLAAKVRREPQAPKYAAETTEALARAMQYAHDHGVVHRDLKPANVLLATNGTPKITDFGLAKRLEQDSGQTQAGTVLGTPSYMAPEQAMGDTANVGPRADVYALGAMLYDLLTGRPPFAGTSVLDTLEMVRTHEPVPPGQLTAKLPKDLETICLKCLQKEEGKRYATAGELADDLRRYLDGKPILARPVGAAERAWRWAKRNPWVAGLGSAVALLLVTVAVLTSIMSYRLNQKRNEAEANFRAAKIAEEREAEEKRNAQAAEAKAVAEKAIREQHWLTAMGLLRGNSLYVDNELKGKLSLAPIRLRVQQVILRDLEKLRKDMADHPLGGRTEAGAHQRMGDVYLNANRVGEAVDEYQKAHAVTVQFERANPDDPVGKRNLAAVTTILGDVELRLGDAAKARDRYAAALALRQKWAEMMPDHPAARQAIAESYAHLGRVDLELGEPAKALENFRAAEKQYSELPKELTGDLNVQRERIEIRDQVGNCLFKLGKADKAEAEHQGAYQVREALAKKYPKQPVLQRDVAASRMSLGDFYLFDRKDPARALVEYAPAYTEYSAQAKADPDDLNAKAEVSAMAYRMGFVADRLADRAPVGGAALRQAATAYYEECLAVRRDLAKADPRDTRGQINVMVALARLGKAAEVETIAAALRKQAGADRRVLFQTACGLAVAAGGTGPDADRCREQAFEVLGKLVDQGWKDRVALETDPDLDAVRGDKRFAELLARVGK
jgi:serine/threonine-protein kinase